MCPLILGKHLQLLKHKLGKKINLQSEREIVTNPPLKAVEGLFPQSKLNNFQKEFLDPVTSMGSIEFV